MNLPTYIRRKVVGELRRFDSIDRMEQLIGGNIEVVPGISYVMFDTCACIILPFLFIFSSSFFLLLYFSSSHLLTPSLRPILTTILHSIVRPTSGLAPLLITQQCNALIKLTGISQEPCISEFPCGQRAFIV